MIRFGVMLCLLLSMLACGQGEDEPIRPLPPLEFGPFAIKKFSQHQSGSRLPPSHPPISQSSNNQPKPRAQSNSQTIQGVLDIHAQVANLIPPGNKTIFIIARPKEGGPPLAVRKVITPKFPHPFTLSAQDMMQPGASFDGEVLLVARLDQDGVAGPPKKGDVESSLQKPVSVGSKGVRLTLSRVY